MLRFALPAACLAIGLTTAFAQSDPISQRKDAMKAVGAATRDGAGIAKGEAPFDAAKVKAIFQTYSEAAAKMATLYPADSKTGGNTSAAPRIWEDQAGFKAALAKFGEASTAAAAASTDLASFRTAFGEVTRNCGSCHEAYRAKR